VRGAGSVHQLHQPAFPKCQQQQQRILVPVELQMLSAVTSVSVADDVDRSSMLRSAWLDVDVGPTRRTS